MTNIHNSYKIEQLNFYPVYNAKAFLKNYSPLGSWKFKVLN